MNWEAIGAIGELLGAVAVVLSLLYVALQVRSSTRQARFDASRELAVRISDASFAAAENPDLAEIFHRGSANPGSLDPVEQVRYRGFVNTLFRGFEQQYLLRRDGAIPDEQWTAVSAIIHDFCALPGVQLYLKDRGAWYTPAFRKYLGDVEGVANIAEGRSMRRHYMGIEDDEPSP